MKIDILNVCYVGMNCNKSERGHCDSPYLFLKTSTPEVRPAIPS